METITADDVIFNPPYTLSSTTAVTFGLFKPDIEKLNKELKFSPDLKILTLFGWALYIGVYSKWEANPEYPHPYNEIISSTLAWTKGKIFSFPLSLYLDNQFHVALGIKYYHLPKHLNPELKITATNQDFKAHSDKINVSFKTYHKFFQVLFLPLILLVGVIVSFTTSILPLIGVSKKPWISSKITVKPQLISGRLASTKKIEIPNLKIHSFLSFIWQHSTSTIFKPITMRD